MFKELFGVGLGALTLCACAGQLASPSDDPCTTRSAQELASELAVCDTHTAPTCAFSPSGAPSAIDPLTEGESICNCRTLASHPNPQDGVYYCFKVEAIAPVTAP